MVNDRRMVMKIRILGAGFYGCHLAVELLRDGHDIVIHELKDRIFGGASGNIPARLHQGFHYPRSKRTRMACQEHEPAFMAMYGKFTRRVATNIYAIAQDASMVDYPQYIDTLKDEVHFTKISPAFFGLTNVEGAVLTQERHIVINDVRAYFEKELDGLITYGKRAGLIDSADYDLTIDATFCANTAIGIDRYEPCVVGLLHGPTDTAVTIMDGPFSSLYPWNEKEGLCSISSAKFTPIRKTCKTWEEASSVLACYDEQSLRFRVEAMVADLAKYYPSVATDYTIAGLMTSIRAMPFSGADARLVDVIVIGERALGIRAGKLDAVIQAAGIVRKHINSMVAK